MTPSEKFAQAYDKRFTKLTAGHSHAEIPLFGAMQSTLTGLHTQFHVEEYHGGKHQVSFTGNGSYARASARCELSDLMIVTYSASSQDIRLTYLQAKSERATLHSICRHHFSANLEQWFLLAMRPTIHGMGNFNPPPDLLSNALLPSIGSFAFFYKDILGNFQTYYACADYLSPTSSYSQRYGKLHASGPCRSIIRKGYRECLAACGNVNFARSLYQLEIGTPIDRKNPQSGATRNWLAGTLRFQIQEAQKTDRPSGLAQELLELLQPEDITPSNPLFGAKSLIIIKSGMELLKG